jgi:hypothetical protein
MPAQRWRFGEAGGRAFTSRPGGSSLVSCRDTPPFVEGADSASDPGGAVGVSTSLWSVIALNHFSPLAGQFHGFSFRPARPSGIGLPHQTVPAYAGDASWFRTCYETILGPKELDRCGFVSNITVLDCIRHAAQNPAMLAAVSEHLNSHTTGVCSQPVLSSAVFR